MTIETYPTADGYKPALLLSAREVLALNGELRQRAVSELRRMTWDSGSRWWLQHIEET